MAGTSTGAWLTDWRTAWCCCGLGYEGGYSTLTEYLRPRRKGRQPEATMRFETAPGEQAQVDWGSLGYVGAVTGRSTGSGSS